MPAPLGNQNASVGKKWKAAIDRALEQRSRLAQKEALDELAERLLQKCDEGDMSALKELGDRLDGKVPQALVGDPENPLHMVSKVERVIIDRTAPRDS